MRNKALVFIFIFSLFGLPLFSQSFIGFTAGGMPGKVQVKAGIHLEAPLKQNLDLLIGIFYQRINTPSLLDLLPNDKNYYDLTISYPGANLSLKQTILNSRLHIYGLGGFYGQYATLAQASYQRGFNFESEKRSFVGLGLERFDVGLSLGLGIEHTLRKHRKIMVMLAYQHSFTPFYIGASRYYHQFLLFNAGLLLPLF